jgi:hypothetical protein
VRVKCYSSGYGNMIRFYGNITDILIDKDTVSIVAVSSLLSRWGKYNLLSTVATTNTSGPIVEAIVNAATGANPNTPSPAVNYFAPGVYQQTVNFPAGTNALEAMFATVAGEPFAFFFEDFSTQAIYCNDQNTRDVASPTPPDGIELYGTDILDDWSVSRSVQSQMNQAIVNYNTGTETYTSTEAIGTLQTTTDTYLDVAANAQQLAQFKVGRGSKLRYEIESITIPIATLGEYRGGTLIFAFRINALIRIPNLRSYIQTDYFIEGWSEEIGPETWTMELYMSDVARSRYYQRWSTVPAARQWGQVPVTTTWGSLTFDWIE